MSHLVRLYPKAWRRRYGAELTDFLEHRRATLSQIVDVLRGALRAHAEPQLPERLVFVSDFGFRPSGTRVLPTRVTTTVDRTILSILSAAATGEETELLVEWDPPDESGPDSWMVKIDRSGVHQRPPTEMDAVLIVGDAQTVPLKVEHRLRSADGYDLRALTFPAIPDGISSAELRVSQGAHEWRLPFTLGPSTFIGGPAGVALEHQGVTIRVTAVAQGFDHIALAFEARARGSDAHVSTIGTGGGPTTFQKHLKTQRKSAYPLVLEDDRGRRSEELSRMVQYPREPETTPDGSWPLRITSVFAWPHPDAMALMLVVPCVVVAENTEPTTIDLRTLPADMQLGPYRVQVVRTEVSPDNPPRTRIVLDLPSLPGSRHLLGPGNVTVQGMRSAPSQSGMPDAQRRMWLDTIVLEEPVITATTALIRVDGPWRFPLST